MCEWRREHKSQVTSRLFAQSQRNIQYKHMSDWAGDTEEPLGYQVKGPSFVVLNKSAI